jgi:hypothetical protein
MHVSRRTAQVAAAGSLAVALAAAGLLALPAEAGTAPGTAQVTAPPGVETVAALPPALTAGRGATVPFVEQEAENATTTGELIGPDRNAYTLPSEASGRRAVRLDAAGEYVEFTLTRDANGLTVRYAIPDAPTGGGITGPLDVYLDGKKRHTITLTSQFSWLYSTYPFSNDPSATPPDDWWIPEPRPVTTPFRPHHFYAEQRLLLDRNLERGDTVRFQLPAGNTLPWAVIDVADFEQVAEPKNRPPRALPVTLFGADPRGQRDAANAFDLAIKVAKALHTSVFIPAGTYQVNRHIIVDDVTVTGAGNWHSIVTGDGVGFYGEWAEDGGSTNVHLADFAIIGNIRDRQDALQVNGIGGAIGGASVIERMYIQRTKVGMWFDGPFDGLTVRDNIIVDQIADALNLRRGISNVTVVNNFARNVGDDGFAMWSHAVSTPDIDMDHDNLFDHNTVIAAVLANGIAIYGGRDNTVTNNLVAESVREGGGLHAGYRHGSTRFAGTLTFDRNTTVRAGILDLNWNFGVGAIWFYALDGVMDGEINVTNSSFLDSTYSAIMMVEGYPIPNSISNIHFADLCIDGAGTYALQIQLDGTSSYQNVTARNLGVGGTWRGRDSHTTIDLGGNDGLTLWPNLWNWPMDSPRPVAPPTNCA